MYGTKEAATRDLKTVTGFLWRPRDTAWTRQTTSPQMQTVPVSPQNITKSMHSTSEDYRKYLRWLKEIISALLCEKKPSHVERLIQLFMTISMKTESAVVKFAFEF